MRRVISVLCGLVVYLCGMTAIACAFFGLELWRPLAGISTLSAMVCGLTWGGSGGKRDT